MTTTDQPRGRSRLVRADPHDALVSPLELFFDLVFVFALTQVSAFMAEDPTFAQLGRGMLILALIWWAWSGYTWLTSTVDPELLLPRLVMFAAMGAMLVVALATPGAFGDDGLLWGLGYLAVRLLHAALFALAARGDPNLARAASVNSAACSRRTARYPSPHSSPSSPNAPGVASATTSIAPMAANITSRGSSSSGSTVLVSQV